MASVASCVLWYDTAEHVASRGPVPTTARDVSYFESHIDTKYEFDISENDFRDWMQSRGWDVREITKPVEITRYKMSHDARQSPESFDMNNPEYWAVVANGLWFEIRQSNGGGVLIVFDRKACRAYGHWASH